MSNRIAKFATTAVVRHGPGSLAQLGAEIEKLGARSPTLVTDEGVCRAGLCDVVYAALGREMPCFAQIEPEPRYTVVDEVTAFLRARL